MVDSRSTTRGIGSVPARTLNRQAGWRPASPASALAARNALTSASVAAAVGPARRLVRYCGADGPLIPNGANTRFRNAREEDPHLVSVR